MSRQACLLATMLALAPAAAHADPADEPPELTILSGLGVRAEWLRDEVASESQLRKLPSFATTIAYRGWTHFALGIHANAARSSDGFDLAEEQASWNVISVDLAIAMQYERDRFTVTPWLGRHLTRYSEDATHCFRERVGEPCTPEHTHVLRWTNDFTSYGLIASFLPVRSMPLAVFLVLQSGLGRTSYDNVGPGEPPFDYSAATLGLAYHQ
jgi:hypothetical protein